MAGPYNVRVKPRIKVPGLWTVDMEDLGGSRAASAAPDVLIMDRLGISLVLDDEPEGCFPDAAVKLPPHKRSPVIEKCWG